MKPESEEEVMLSMEGLRGEGGEGQLVGGEQTPEGGGFLKTISEKSANQFVLLFYTAYFGKLSLSPNLDES